MIDIKVIGENVVYSDFNLNQYLKKMSWKTLVTIISVSTTQLE